MVSRTINDKFYLLEDGERNWGGYQNSNWINTDSNLKDLEDSIYDLENSSQILPIALSEKIGHNICKNGLFTQFVTISPEKPIDWISSLQNGAIGYSTRKPDSIVINGLSLQLTISSVNLANQTRPWNFLADKIYDIETDQIIPSYDTRNILLTNSIHYSYQSVYLKSNTQYTLSAFGKTDIINLPLGVNVNWKLGIVFKNGSDIYKSYFTEGQNYSGLDFQRKSLTFKTPPNLSICEAEIWLVCQGSIPNSIGSCWFTGVQLEQCQKATQFESLVTPSYNLGGNYTYQFDGDVDIKGNLILSQSELIFNQKRTLFKGSVQIGENPDGLNKIQFDVFAKKSTFHGPVFLNDDVTIGDNSSDDTLKINTISSKFQKHPQTGVGGSVEVDGYLTIHNLTQTDDLIINNLSKTNYLEVNRKAKFGFDLSEENDVYPSFEIKSPTKIHPGIQLEGITRFKKDSLSTINPNVIPDITITQYIPKGSVIIDEDLRIGSGSPTSKFLANVKDCHLISTHLVVDDGIEVIGASHLHNTFSNFLLNDNVVISSSNNISETCSQHILNNQQLIISNLQTDILSRNITLGIQNQNNRNLNLYFDDIEADGNFEIKKNLTVLKNGYFGENLFISGNIINLNSGFLLADSQAKIFTVGKEDEFVICNFNSSHTYFGNHSTPGSEKEGHVTVAGNLQVDKNITLGNGQTNSSILTANLKKFDLTLESDFNIGGGYNSTRFYTELEEDHGGVSIDNKGNIVANGKIEAGKIKFDGGELVSRYGDIDGRVVLEVDRERHDIYGHTFYENVFKLNNLGDIQTKGSIKTEKSGNSNLSTISVTVGDGLKTFGDFSNIEDAIAYIKNIRYSDPSYDDLGGIILIKRGAYNIPDQGIILGNNISLVGEGKGSTILNCLGDFGLHLEGFNSIVRDLEIRNAREIAINVAENYCEVSRVSISDSKEGILINSIGNNINNCWIRYGQRGITYLQDGNIVTGCYIKDNSTYGVKIEINGSIVRFMDTRNDIAYDGISGNFISDNGGV